jgi:hypothetical protein
MKKIIITISLFSIFSWLTNAQTGEHMLSVQAGGGFHHLVYSPTGGSEKGNAGFCLDLNYGYFFGKHAGLVSGVGIQSLKSTSTLQLQTSVSDIDTDGDTYEFRTTYNTWKENQGSYMLSIPIGVMFRGDWNKKVSWYAGTGVTAFIPLVAKYAIESGNIVTSGYYSEWDVELTDMPRHGFTAVEGSGDGDITLKTSVGAFFNAGITLKLSERMNLGAGLYSNYGFTSATDKKDVAPYQKSGTYNSCINSSLVSETKIFSAGIQVGLMWVLK